jgi:hypothetical protein
VYWPLGRAAGRHRAALTIGGITINDRNGEFGKVCGFGLEEILMNDLDSEILGAQASATDAAVVTGNHRQGRAAYKAGRLRLIGPGYAR